MGELVLRLAGLRAGVGGQRQVSRDALVGIWPRWLALGVARSSNRNPLTGGDSAVTMVAIGAVR
jgi:hypothetical protein